jgi:molybdopterin-guanine dinucleotide biosynthesis protein A
MDKPHQKHERLARPSLGAWGHTELALHGANCETLAAFKDALIQVLPEFRFAWADASHEKEEPAKAAQDIGFHLRPGGTDLRLPGDSDPFLRHLVLRDADLVLINGNHFNSAEQILFVTEEKPMEQKLERLQHIRLVLVRDTSAQIPAYLVPFMKDADVLGMQDTNGIAAFFRNYISSRTPALNGLIMAGGKSTRMGQDKSLIDYHGKPQREFLLELMAPLCKEVFISCGAVQEQTAGLPVIHDKFLGIGPMAGLLSAFQQQPDAAWLCVACDLPYLSRLSLDNLIKYRDPTKMATAFLNGDAEHPEPLVTIWEPKAYPRLLLALSEGLTCPRKVLINSDVRLLQAPDERELINANDPASYEQALVNLKAPGPRG